MFQKTKQSGQTLVETVVGLVVLTVGISTSLALATTIFTQSTQASKQVIAVGLAREGVEAWFNMRGTNWLRSELYDGCYDYIDDDETAYCKPDWEYDFYQLEGASSGVSYTLDIDTTDLERFWSENLVGGDFELYLDSDMNSGRLYSTNSSDGSFSGFYRQIVVSYDIVSPYDLDTFGEYERYKIQSRVWWSGRGCPATSAWPDDARCRLELNTFMTNWRNY